MFAFNTTKLLYESNLRPILESSAWCVWHTWLKIELDKLERTQNHVRRFIFANHSTHFSVSSAKERIDLQKLYECPKKLIKIFSSDIFFQDWH